MGCCCRKEPLVVCIGEVLWDCFPDRRVLGGAPLNCAYMAQGLGARAAMVSRVGVDAEGEEILAIMQAKGMDVTYVQRDPQRPTGRVLVELSGRGLPTYTIIDGVAWDNIQWDDKLGALAAAADAVCFGTLAQRSPRSHATIERFLNAAGNAVTVFDINLRQNFYSRDIIEAGLRRGRIVKLNDDEVAMLRGMFPDAWTQGETGFMAAFDIDLLAVTKGPKGCVLFRGDEKVCLPVKDLAIEDTVGAGDAFTAALIRTYLQGATLEAMGWEANLLGTYVTTCKGATPSLDDWRRTTVAAEPL